MKKRKSSPRSRTRTKPHLICSLLALALGLSSHSCTDIPVQQVQSAEIQLEKFVKELGTAMRERSGTPAADPEPSSATVTRTVEASDNFSACRQFFAGEKPPVVAPRSPDRALCYDAFAILHSGESKTPIFVAERLNRASVADANEKRTNRFFPDARLPSAERATLDDYKDSGFDRGHMAPAGDMPTAQAMAQSFSLANMVPQVPEHNRGTWAKSVEAATRKYAARATGSRRRIWIDAQTRKWHSFEELNAWLGERCRALWSEIRHPEYKHFSVLEMLEQERSEMMPMPTPFDGYVERSAKVSSTCLVAVARNRYSVPCELAGQRVSTRLYPTRVEIASDEAIVACHARVADRGHICYDWQHYIALVQRKPGALRNGAPFADMPPPLQRLRQGLMRHDGGDKTMAQVLNCVASHGLEAVLVAVELVIESGVLSTEHVLNVLARLNASELPQSVESTLQLKELPVADTGRYDSLRSVANINNEIDTLLEVNHAS
jgi:hypothetical protein